MSPVFKELAHGLGLVPLVWVAVLSLLAVVGVRSKQPDAALWWLGVAFGVSFVADSAKHWFGLSTYQVLFSYVVSQSVLVVAVYRRTEAIPYLAALSVLGVVAWYTRDARGHDYLLHAVAWGSAARVVWMDGKGLLRTALVIYFAGGLLTYLVLTAHGTYTTWSAYQLTRLVGIALFCVACLDLAPRLRLTRS